jgi:large subunit ribosomal protein L4
MCLSDKVKDKKLYILDKLNLSEIKTKVVFNILSLLIPDYKDSSKKVLLSLPEKDLNVIRSARNIENLKIVPVTDLNILDCLKSEYLIITVAGLKKIEKHFKPYFGRKS